jgi:hypothetical protein
VFGSLIPFSKAFDLVLHNRLLTKIAATGVDFRVDVWVKEFLLGRSQRVRIDGQLSEEDRVTSGVPNGNVLGPLIFLASVSDIWRSNECNIRLFADDCKINRKITDSSDTDKLQTGLNKLGEWAVENEIPYICLKTAYFNNLGLIAFVLSCKSSKMDFRYWNCDLLCV